MTARPLLRYSVKWEKRKCQLEEEMVAGRSSIDIFFWKDVMRML